MLRFIAAAAFALSTAALAQADVQPTAAGGTAAMAPVEKPTPEAIQSFWNFYFKGKGSGPALADSKLCLEVGKVEGDTKNECVKEVPAEGIKAGTQVIIWQAYLLPSGENVEDMSLQVKLGDTVRETKDIKLKGESIRTRNWTTVRIPKAGTWNLVLMKGDQVMKTFTVKAT